MVKKLVLFLVILTLVPALTYAQGKFTVSGEVTFQYDGDIYVCILTMGEFQDFNKPRHELSQSPCKTIHMNTDIKKAGKVSFTFNNVPKGAYCVFTYQDVNMNGQVDFENLRMCEPWGSYKEAECGLSPVWGTIRFDVDKDIAGITIKM